MGGGDLNLKKSWHPQTFHNLERVWKAEQKDEREKKKIQDLQQEIQEERAREEMQRMAVEAGVSKKKDERVDWLYSGPGSSVNREEYLLGKKIDRLVDPTLIEEEREREALASGPGALFTTADATSSVADIAVKVREDPLFMIRKREEEAKTLLASNPVKLRQLQQLVSKEKRREKHKRSKKAKHRHSKSETVSDDSPHQWSDDSPHKWSGSLTRTHAKEKGRASAVRTTPPGDPNHKPSHKRYRPMFPAHRRSQLLSSHSWSPSSSSRYHPYTRAHSHTRHMDPAELEKRRLSMMASAREHGKEREGRLRKHQEERRLEEQVGKEPAHNDFLHPLRVQSLTSSQSVGERIHRHISSVQRTSAALNANFMEKK